MKCGSIFYKIIVLIDYFCIHFINDNEKQREEYVREGEREREREKKQACGKILSKPIERNEIIETYIFFYIWNDFLIVCARRNLLV